MNVFTRTLLARLVAYFSALSLMVVTVLGFSSYVFFVRDLRRATFDKLSAVALVKENALKRWVEEKRNAVVMIARWLEDRPDTRILLAEGEKRLLSAKPHSAVDEFLRRARTDFPDLEELFILAPKGGRVICSTKPENEGAYRFKDTFFIEGKDRTFIQNVYPSPSKLEPAMTISTPLTGGRGELIGVLAADLDLKAVDRIIQKRVGLGATGVANLVDRYSVLVSGTRFGSEEFPRGVHSEGIDRAIGGSSGYGIYTNHVGVRVLGVHRWIPSLELALVVEVQEGEMLRSARRKLIPVAAIGIGLVGLLAAAVSMSALRIARPILSIKEAAVRVAGGDLEAKAPILTRDEVGVLAESFNRMTSELKVLYGALKREKEHFRALIECSADIILVLDREGRVKLASPSMKRVLGYGQGETLGRRFSALVHPQDHEALQRNLLEPIGGDGDTGGRATVRMRHSDGGWRVIELAAKNLLEGGAVSGIVVNAHDVTEKIEAEKALRESEEAYRQYFEEDLTGDYTALPDGTILTCNPAFARIMGFQSVEEARGRTLASFYPGAAEFERFVETLKTEKKLEYREAEMRNLRGNHIFVVENTKGKFDPSGKLVEIRGYIFDNTERKRLEEQLHQVQKMEAVARLAGGIAHDFNNLLTAIIGYSDIIMQRRSLDERTASEVREIKKAANRAAGLTHQLLAYSRKQVLRPKLVDLNSLITDIENLIRRLIGEDIQFVTSLEPGLRMVKTDPGQMEQVVMNLVVNSRDAMPNGGEIVIQTKNECIDSAARAMYPEMVPGNYVLLSVRDTGCGMDEKTMERIFEPFFTTKEVGKGTGLGMSTVFGIVKQSGGHIAVQSRVNGGTTVRVYLPGADVSCGEEPEEPECTGSRERESILVVEDDEAVRRIMKMSLDKVGYRVYEAEGPASALEMWETLSDGRIDLVITDVVMPRMDGKKLAERLVERSNHTRVLYVSGYTDDTIIHHGVLEDRFHFLQKPFTPEALARKVREILDG